MPEGMQWQLAMQLVGMALTGVCGALWGQIKGAAAERKKKAEESKEERDKSRAGMRLLLFYRIHDLVTDAEKAGFMPDADKQKLAEAYGYYHNDFDGNGSGTQMYQRGMVLPSQPPVRERGQQ